MSRVFAITLGILLLSTTAEATWEIDGNPACTNGGTQQSPSLVLDAAGGVIVFWKDNRSTPSHIYAQRYSPNGDPLWSTNGVLVSNPSREQTEPRAVTDGVGGAIVSYVQDQAITDDDIFAQRVDPNGVPLWGNGVPLCDEMTRQTSPQIISDARGGITDTPGAIVVWQDSRGGATSDIDIYAQAIDANGSIRWIPQGVPVCSAPAQQLRPVLVTDGAGFFSGPKGAIITWEDQRNGPSDIYAQRLNSSGQPQWTSDGDVVCNAPNAQNSPSITYVGGGNAIVVWRDRRTAEDDVWAQRVGPSGSWLANGLPVCRAPSYQSNVVATTDGTDGAIVAWSDGRGNPYAGNVYAQRINGLGAPYWQVDGVAVSAQTGWEEVPAIAPSVDQSAVVVWSQQIVDLRAQRLDSNGARVWDPNGVSVCTGANAQFDYVIVPDGLGGIYAAWTDDRNGNYDIYVQHVGDTPVPVAHGPVQLVGFRLLGAVPNPSVQASNVRFMLREPRSVSAYVYGIDGRLIRTLERDRTFSAGNAAVHWDGNDTSGWPVSSGFYFVRVEAGWESATTKVAIVR